MFSNFNLNFDIALVTRAFIFYSPFVAFSLKAEKLYSTLS